MTKVYPNAVVPAVTSPATKQHVAELFPVANNPVILTVWKKSLLFNCKGFTVFDSTGNLVFRVDNYVASSKPEIILMDASGSSLLTIRRKRLSLSDNWLVYDKESTVNPRFSVTKHVNLLNTKSLAHVSSIGSPENNNNGNKRTVIYQIEGSYVQRCCVVYDAKRRRVAEIKRKEAVGGVAFGGDVFRLVVQPEIDPTVAMALVIVLDQMFQ